MSSSRCDNCLKRVHDEEWWELKKDAILCPYCGYKRPDIDPPLFKPVNLERRTTLSNVTLKHKKTKVFSLSFGLDAFDIVLLLACAFVAGGVKINTYLFILIVLCNFVIQKMKR